MALTEDLVDFGKLEKSLFAAHRSCSASHRRSHGLSERPHWGSMTVISPDLLTTPRGPLMTHPRPFGPTAQLQRLLHSFVLDPAWADSLLTVDMVLDLATELMAEGAEAVVFTPLVVLWM